MLFISKIRNAPEKIQTHQKPKTINSQTIYGRLVETLEPYLPLYIDAYI